MTEHDVGERIVHSHLHISRDSFPLRALGQALGGMITCS